VEGAVLGNAQPGDTFTAKVTVVGAEVGQSALGASTVVPDFSASTFTVTG
jgi:hypothetical protein